MTKDEILKSYLNDPLFQEMDYMSKEKCEKIQFGESSGVKLVEIIKLAISGNIDRESEQITLRKILSYLNK
ncbi:hypothetical protein SanaruYs_34560 [Chryseotalea sanaruensis]|uniref:Uncharacterized protein n=1 Tax=Chryseotalea sanaruensis TaxID=2482724 RepID=A0A401UE98_9BACT|nr:hypothetical protein [Chryseotalea sanaruensis]GCC53213.1 hypothetical protein SanaruYs_34560 [Chryseotalea sanaruensis]